MYIQARSNLVRDLSLDNPGLDEVFNGRRIRNVTARERALVDSRLQVVAEGDSWFWYLRNKDNQPLSLDQQENWQIAVEKAANNDQAIAGALAAVVTGSGYDAIDFLMDYRDIFVRNIARGGDTLENMVRAPGALENIVHLLEQHPNDFLHKPRVLLLSGGGNDFAMAFEGMLRPKSGDNQPIDDERSRRFFNDLHNKYTLLMDSLISQFGEGIQVFTHGYGKAVPSGLGLINWAGSSLSWFPCWLKNPLVNCGYTEEKEQKTIINSMIDRFASTLKGIAEDPKYRNQFHHLDLRDSIQDDWWINEYHLYNSGFKVVADEFYYWLKKTIGDW